MNSARSPFQARESAHWPLALDLLVVATAGGLHGVAFASPTLWWIQVLTVGVLAWRVRIAGVGRAVALGWAFSVAWLGLSVWWLSISMNIYGRLPWWVAWAAVAVLCAALALLLGLAMGLFARVLRGHPVVDGVLFAACWMLAELARGQWLTGFPWAAAGYAHADSPLAALAPWVGVYGVGAAAALLAALMVYAFAVRVSPQPAYGTVAIAASGLLALALWGGGYHTRPGPTVHVTLLQPNIAQDIKFNRSQLPATLEWLHKSMADARGDLVIAPETAVPVMMDQLPPGYWQSVQSLIKPGAPSILVGMPLGDPVAGYTNSAVGLAAPRQEPVMTGSPVAAATVSADPDTRRDFPYRYDKHHLVPFGEFIPPGFRWFTEMMAIPLGDFNRGDKAPPSFEVRVADGRVRVAPTICYEDLFGEEIAARFVDEAQAPGLLANLSNIAWFGNTVAVPQHLEISRMRALELQRPMVRATNTGATVIIDHTGRVLDRLGPFTRGALSGVVQSRYGLTPYASWVSRLGLWPLWFTALLLIALLRRRPRVAASGATRHGIAESLRRALDRSA